MWRALLIRAVLQWVRCNGVAMCISHETANWLNHLYFCHHILKTLNCVANFQVKQGIMAALESGRPPLGGLTLLVCLGLDTQILCVVPPRSLKEMLPGDGVLFFHALECEDGILRAAFNDDLASLSLVRY